MVDTRQLDQPSVNFRDPIRTFSLLSFWLIVPNSPVPKSSASVSKSLLSSAFLKKPESSPMLIRPKGSNDPTRRASSPLLFFRFTNFSRCLASALNSRFRISS